MFSHEGLNPMTQHASDGAFEIRCATSDEELAESIEYCCFSAMEIAD
jgi:hypothetical protein